MKMRVMITVFLIGAFLSAFSPAIAYTIDGDLSDWGLSRLATGDWSADETWIPAEHVSFIVEDNVDPRLAEDTKGVHLRGIGSSWVFYNEPQWLHTYLEVECCDPYGGEEYDMEAFYFDQDREAIYVAIVTSLKPDGTGGLCPHDLALNVRNDLLLDDLGYEYGVKIGDGTMQGAIIHNPVWERAGHLYPEQPDYILQGTGKEVGQAEIAYTNHWVGRSDNGFENYIIEIAIRKKDLGVTGDISFSSICYADSIMCSCILAPEFPGIAISLAIITGMVFVVHHLWIRIRIRNG